MKLVFEAYLASDPNGTPLGELDRATDKWVRVQYNGDGEGGFTIDRHEAQAAWFEPSADPVYIKAYIDDTSGDPIFGFLPDSGGDTILAAEEEGAEEYVRSGKGALSYLADAILWAKPYAPTDSGTVTADGDWRWGSTNLGSILLRLVNEAQARTCFPDVTMAFTRTLDSASDAWDIVAAEYKLPIGMNLREALSALQSAGLIVRMDPDLVLHAWNDHPGADVSGSVILTPTVNLRDSVERQVQASPVITNALVQGDLESGALKFRSVVDAAVLADLGRRKEAYVQYNATPTNAVLDRVGHKAIDATKAQYDGPTSVPVLIRTNEVPFTDYQPGDLIGVSLPGAAGSIRVAAISLIETDTGEVDPVLDLGEETFDPIEALASGPSRGARGPGGTGGGSGGGGTPPVADSCGMTDTFDRADGAPGYSDAGVLWVVYGGTALIESGRMRVQGSGGQDGDVLMTFPALGSPMEGTFEFSAGGTSLNNSFFVMGLATVEFSAGNVVVYSGGSGGSPQTSIAFPITTGTVYKVHILYTEGTPDNIKVNIWAIAGAEPSGWMVDHDDDTPGGTYNSTFFGVLSVLGNSPLYIDDLDIEGLDECDRIPFDTFTRTVVSGWGTSTDGHPWTLTESDPSVDEGVDGSAGWADLPDTESLQADVSGPGPWDSPDGFVMTAILRCEDVPDPNVISGNGSMIVHFYTDLAQPSVDITISKGAGVDGWDGKVRIQEFGIPTDVAYAAFADNSPFTVKWERRPGGIARVKIWQNGDPEPGWLSTITAEDAVPTDFEVFLVSDTPQFTPNKLFVEDIRFTRVLTPIPGQWVYDEPFIGDGSTTAYTTDFRYIGGTMHLRVNGLDWTGVLNETNPGTGAYSLDYAPPLGSTVEPYYQAAG